MDATPQSQSKIKLYSSNRIFLVTSEEKKEENIFF